MARYEYKLAAGHDNTAGFANIEDTLTTVSGDRAPAPRRSGVTRGSQTRTSIAQTARTDGTQSFTWNWRVLPLSDLDTIITTYLTDWDTDYANVTVRTRKRDGTYANYNAILYLPQEGQDYELAPDSSYVTGLSLRFSVVEAL